MAAAKLDLALVGKTGSGKSSLGNALLGKDVFDKSCGFDSETKKCVAGSKSVGSRKITVVDTPGTMDTHDEETAMKELKTAIRFCPYGLHAFLLVVMLGRFTKEERDAIEGVRQVFGGDFYGYCIVVFTHGDKCQNDEEKLKDQLEKSRPQMKELDQLLTKCGERFVMIDNSGNCDKQLQEKQVGKLLQAVDKLQSAKGSRYTNKLFKKAQEEIKEKKRLEEQKLKEEQELKEKEEREKEKVLNIKDEMERKMQMMKLEMEMKQAMEMMQVRFENAMLENKLQAEQRMNKELKRQASSGGSSCCIQ